MIFKNSIKFKIKNKLFKIQNVKLADISNNYISSLNNSKYLKYKKKHTIFFTKTICKENKKIIG